MQQWPRWLRKINSVGGPLADVANVNDFGAAADPRIGQPALKLLF